MNTKKLFMLLAAMLLVSVSAFAQSGNNNPLKGDVNGDGVVDEEDIAAVIAIIKNSAQPQKTYYWYVGIIPPTDPSNAEENSGFNKWTVLPDSQASVQIYAEDENLIEHTWYLAAPASRQFVTSFNGTQVGGWTTSTITINGVEYTVWTGMAEADTVNTTLAKLK